MYRASPAVYSCDVCGAGNQPEVRHLRVGLLSAQISSQPNRLVAFMPYLYVASLTALLYYKTDTHGCSSCFVETPQSKCSGIGEEEGTDAGTNSISASVDAECDTVTQLKIQTRFNY